MLFPVPAVDNNLVVNFTGSSILVLFILISQAQFLLQSFVVAAYDLGPPVGDCTNREEDSICDPTRAGLCRNHTCQSACARLNMRQCNCPSEDDNYCYLCCGNSASPCLPAHHYKIYKPNGEHWEREACRRCHDLPDGVPCDDKSDRRICLNKRCTANACLNHAEGAYCDSRRRRVCVDGDCRDPCREHSPLLATCECDTLRGRCELCCYDYKSKQCESAYRKYGIANKDGRPIARIGLTCDRKQHHCNTFGRCAAASSFIIQKRSSLTSRLLLNHLLLLALMLFHT
ncbi:Uncharacterized protein T11_420 [Trichinella zimbabwensis]|uniref:Uncharacterized protein n=1 Tax=Trichinella zimbabwensis TaxID=268475 RepID=A0A0V1HAX7_9BILA|nr:Uncharacterized protein T11_420 [Trichinella zimbabwensis]